MAAACLLCSTMGIQAKFKALHAQCCLAWINCKVNQIRVSRCSTRQELYGYLHAAVRRSRGEAIPWRRAQLVVHVQHACRKWQQLLG